MRYISTRNNSPSLSSAEAISLGMVPSGGLFVPESLPSIDPVGIVGETYAATAKRVLTPLLSDFTEEEINFCIDSAYTNGTFSIPSITNIKQLNKNISVLELWHGPTAAFKDVALQIMPHLLAISKNKTNNTAHTVILVATSGDTGKAALEGFSGAEGISIIVFYPDQGVSEIQKLQMVTTEGDNTYVIAVRGNFDDCQNGVKEIFGNSAIRANVESNGFELSSANSINWGRLCPQIVYYFRAYSSLVESGSIANGDPISFSIPTGNFGNILAGYYAKQMGLPIKKLICASNRNNVLADFFKTGIYNRNREFHKTISPSMDILISSNLERFLFEITGKKKKKIVEWYSSLARTGQFEVDSATKQIMDSLVDSNWVDEPEVLTTIAGTYNNYNYVIDTHTAVALAIAQKESDKAIPVVVASTASPFKFSSDVLKGLNGQQCDNEFDAIESIAKIWGKPVHPALHNLNNKPIRFKTVINDSEMASTILELISKINP